MKELKIKNSSIPALVDDEDYDRLSKFTWNLQGGYNGFGGSIQRHTHVNGESVNIGIANEIMQNSTLKFDHKDRNPFNNQKSNFRQTTNSLNSANREKFVGDFSSKYKGVSKPKTRQKYDARIRVNRKAIYLGSFSTELDAAKAYNEAAIRYFGEHACLNSI